jgi:hypothetical protein
MHNAFDAGRSSTWALEISIVDPDPDPGSGSVLDPSSIGSVDPDPYSESGSGSRRAKMTHKSRQYLVKVHVLKCWMASFEN